MKEERRIREGEIARAEKLAKREGWKQGSNDKSIEIAKSMLEKNMDIELISELTNLSKDETSNL